MEIFELSQYNQTIARQIIEDTRVVEIWENSGAEVNPVGSLQSGLMMTHRDIDFHIYTDELVIKDSFAVISELSKHPRIKEVLYRNLIDTEEECIEWHAWYEDHDNNRWQLDMIHIRRGSLYDGVVEHVTDEIRAKLTPEIKEAILRIKYLLPEEMKIPGIDVYRAVFSYGIREYEDFLQWHRNDTCENRLMWRP